MLDSISEEGDTMRLWHKDLLKYLPRQQLISQFRECCCIARNIAVNGTPNHILVNRIMDYPLIHFYTYTGEVIEEMLRRGYRCDTKKFNSWMFKLDGLQGPAPTHRGLFNEWHNTNYATQCYYNLQEKHDCFGISDEEWRIFESGFWKVRDALEKAYWEDLFVTLNSLRKGKNV